MNTYEEYLKSNGTYLKPIIGVDSWALNKEHALAAAQILKDSHIPILGVDVLLNKDEKFYFIYQNQVQGSFACNKKIEESDHDFVERSATEVRNYVETYPNSDEGDRFFTLTPEAIVESGLSTTK